MVELAVCRAQGVTTATWCCCSCVQGGVFGAVATTDQLLAALGPPAPVNGTANAPQSHPLAPSTPTPAPTAPLSAKPAAATKGAGVVAVVADAKPYAYQLPVSAAALVMIDFQRDFMEPGGFGAALGNDVGLLQVGAGWRPLYMAIWSDGGAPGPTWHGSTAPDHM